MILTSDGRRLTLIAALLAVAGCSADDHEARRQRAGPNPDRQALARVASAAAGARRFAACAACHAISPGAPDRNGPNLYGVMGQPIGRNSARFGYTAALQGVGGRWTAERMDRWLADPQAFAPGTAMRYPGVSDPLDRADLIAFIESRR